MQAWKVLISDSKLKSCTVSQVKALQARQGSRRKLRKCDGVKGIDVGTVKLIKGAFFLTKAGLLSHRLYIFFSPALRVYSDSVML